MKTFSEFLQEAEQDYQDVYAGKANDAAEAQKAYVAAQKEKTQQKLQQAAEIQNQNQYVRDIINKVKDYYKVKDNPNIDRELERKYISKQVPV